MERRAFLSLLGLAAPTAVAAKMLPSVATMQPSPVAPSDPWHDGMTFDAANIGTISAGTLCAADGSPMVDFTNGTITFHS